MYAQRKTINTTVSITGIGLHSGIYTRVALHPARIRERFAFQLSRQQSARCVSSYSS